MEEVSNSPQAMGSGQPQQHPVHHTRPFFYVQQPSQPYYMYPWHVNNPYGHYGFPGSGLPFGRPYMAPYAYMQYPGYVVPHAPIQPIDYRRMFNTYFPSAVACDTRFRSSHICMRRETACSEAQTEPSDAVNKLIKTLDKLVTREVINSKADVASGVSQDSGTCLPGDGRKCDGQELQPKPTNVMESDTPLPPPIVPSGDSCTAVYKEESTLSPHEKLAQQERCVTPESVLPLDGSLVCEAVGLHSVVLDRQGNVRLEPQVPCGVNILCEVTLGHAFLPRAAQDSEGPVKQSTDPAQPSTHCLPEEAAEPRSDETSETFLPASAGSCVGDEPPVDIEELPYQILRLPFDKVSPVGLLQKDSPLWCVDQLSSFIQPASYLSSLGNGYYSYYPQTVQERQSVLSPSLDEMSSRDEVFSTDLEDMDLIPGHVYLGDGRPADGTGETQDPNVDGDFENFSSSEECSVCSRKTCATCGSALSRKTKWSQVYSPKVYEPQEKEDTEEEAVGENDDCETEQNACELLRAPLTKQSHPKRNIQPRCGRQASRQKFKKGHCEVQEHPACLEVVDQGSKSLGACCEEHLVMVRAEKYKGQEPRNIQSRPSLDEQQNEGAVASDQESWESCCVKGRQKLRKPYPSLRGQEKPPRRKASCKTLGPKKSRRKDRDDNGGEFPHFHRGRGMSATQQPLGTGPHSPNVSDGPPGSPSGTGSTRNSCQGHAEGFSHQHHPRPFFYVQPSQPYVPYQWHMPMQYGPYYPFPGFGYGVVMPASPYGFPPNPYMEAPGYVVPYTQLHLSDYRRMLNPHYTPTMAYHTRRFRYQHVTTPRETISSEVQTDPQPQGTSDSWLSGASEPCARSVQSTGSDSGQGSTSANTSTSLNLEASLQAAGRDAPSDTDVGVTPTLPRATATPKGACVFQREEVRIECSGGLSGLKIVRSHETTAESTQDAPGDLAQCDIWSVSSAEGIIPLYRSPLPEGAAITQDAVCLSERLEQQPSVPSYPDILLVGGSPSSSTEKPELPCTKGCEAPAGKPAAEPGTDVVQVCREVRNGNASSLKEACFKILRLPFEMRYLEELRKVEESVWSVKPLVPFIPSAEWMSQHRLEDAGTETTVPTKNEASDVPMETSASQPLVTSPVAGCEESITVPPYLPSGSWLADFGNVYYYSKLPPSVHEHCNSFSTSTEQLPPGGKLSQDSEGQAVVAVARRMAGKHTCLLGLDGKGHICPKGQSLSPNRNALVPRGEGERTCPRCIKRSVPCGPTLKLSGVKRHRTAPPSPPDMPPQHHVACRCCLGKALRKGSGQNVLSSQNGSEEMEYEAEGNSAHSAISRQQSCEGKRAVGSGGAMASKRHSDKCSVQCAKLREKNCTCKDHGDAGVHGGPSWGHTGMVGICNEENVAVSIPVPDKRRTREQRCNTQCQAEKSWEGTVTASCKGDFENGSRPKNLKQRKQRALSQEKLHSKLSSKVTAQPLQKNDNEAPIEGFFSQSSWTKHGTNRRDTRY